MSKKSILFMLLVGQVFLWTGSAFISVLYRLYDFYEPAQVTLFTEVLYYVMQAVGIALYALCLKQKPQVSGGKRFAAISALLTGVFTALALFLESGIGVMLMGLVMNIGIGLLSGVYLTRLAAQIPQQHRGQVFGFSYAIGSIGTWLLSLLYGGKLLQSGAAVYVFIALGALSMFLTRYLKPIKVEPDTPQIEIIQIDKKLFMLAVCIPLICSVVNGLGYFFSAADLTGALDPAFTRIFYAVGLIAAGIINDKNRRYGAICCIAALIFPFVGLALRNEIGISVFLSIFSYIFYGFFSVYRVVLFADLAGKRDSFLYLAVFGLLAGRIGDAIGTFGGMALEGNQLLLTCAAACAFIVCALLFFTLYHKLYIPRLSEKENTEALLSEFETHYAFTSRQAEVFRLVIKGCSNAEISSELFLSESTVKFHMKNILKSSGCANRTELTAKFHKTVL